MENIFTKLSEQPVAAGDIDDVVFIDGIKILANANKYSFVWRKNTIRFSELNNAKAVALLEEIKASQADFFHEETELSFDDMDDVIARLEMHIDEDRPICGRNQKGITKSS